MCGACESGTRQCWAHRYRARRSRAGVDGDARQAFGRAAPTIFGLGEAVGTTPSQSRRRRFCPPAGEPSACRCWSPLLPASGAPLGATSGRMVGRRVARQPPGIRGPPAWPRASRGARRAPGSGRGSVAPVGADRGTDVAGHLRPRAAVSRRPGIVAGAKGRPRGMGRLRCAVPCRPGPPRIRLRLLDARRADCTAAGNVDRRLRRRAS